MLFCFFLLREREAHCIHTHNKKERSKRKYQKSSSVESLRDMQLFHNRNQSYHTLQMVCLISPVHLSYLNLRIIALQSTLQLARFRKRRAELCIFHLHTTQRYENGELKSYSCCKRNVVYDVRMYVGTYLCMTDGCMHVCICIYVRRKHVWMHVYGPSGAYRLATSDRRPFSLRVVGEGRLQRELRINKENKRGTTSCNRRAKSGGRLFLSQYVSWSTISVNIPFACSFCKPFSIVFRFFSKSSCKCFISISTSDSAFSADSAFSY